MKLSEPIHRCNYNHTHQEFKNYINISYYNKNVLTFDRMVYVGFS